MASLRGTSWSGKLYACRCPLAAAGLIVSRINVISEVKHVTTYINTQNINGVFGTDHSNHHGVFLMRLLPGDPLIIYMGQSASQQALPQAQIDMLKHQFGLDLPLPVQYFKWVGGVFHGGFWHLYLLP